MNMAKRTFLMLLAAMIAITAFCQESDSKKINKIKRNNQYLYAEATTKDPKEAYETALELLNSYIDEYVKSKKKYNSSENIIIKDIGQKSEKIQMKRGELTRVFVYVNKKDIIPAENSTLRENAGKKEKEKELVSQVEPIEPQEGNISLRLEKAWQQELIDQILSCQTLIEAKSLLNRQKAEFRVKRTGAPASCRNKAASYWVIGDEAGNLVTVLGMGSNERTNFRTLQVDSLENYPDAVAVWFTMSD